MTKEALRLALEAFEYIEHNYMSLPAPATKAITAIKAALEAKGEPLAYLPPTASPDNACYNPSQRTWVGLTDEDFQPAVQKAMVYYGYKPEHLTLTSGAGFYALVRDIEAKLKEKNT